MPGYYSNDNPSILRHHQTGAIWHEISAYSSIPLDELTGGNIDRPENCIALDHLLYKWFGNLSLWFEPTGDVSFVLKLYRLRHFTKVKEARRLHGSLLGHHKCIGPA